MLSVALAFCAGAAAVFTLPALPPVAAWLLAGATAWISRRKLVAAACLGLAWTGWFAHGLLADRWPCGRDREEITLTGIVATPATRREGRVDFDLDVITPTVSDRLPGRVRLSWYEAAATPRPGERWRMTVRLRCPRGLVNPGAADRELDLLRQRIGATGYVVQRSPVERLDAGERGRAVERLRARIGRSIAEALAPGPSVAVLQGLSVGLRGSVPEALWDAFAATGVAHLMAISGLHVTGCAIAMLLLLRACWRLPGMSRLPARAGSEALVVVAVTAGYTLLSGASAPALRTLAMVAIVALLRALRRSLPLHQLLSLAALLMVAADPLALTSAGFWMSFVATAALLTLLAEGRGWRARLALFARGQAAVTMLLTPVLAAAFGRLSLVSPLANAIAIPVFTGLLLPAVLFATMLDAAWPGAAVAVWRALAGVLDRCWPALEAMAAWPFASWAPAAQPLALIGAAGLVTLAALLLPLSGLRAAAAVLLLAVACGRASRPAPEDWTLTVIDVGQGLATVVETQNHVLVFDTGPRWLSGGAAARISLLPYLRMRGIRRLDRLVVSHDDLDHAGGEVLLRSSLPVRQSSAAGRCRRGESWQWDGVQFRVLHPPSGMVGSRNDLSCALSVRSAAGSALLLADPEARGEQALLAMPLASDVVLLPHHGSRSSSSAALIAAAGARLGIASAGFGNRWGMPVAEVLARWRSAGTTVLQTAESGAIQVRFRAGSRVIEVSTARGRAPRWWRHPAPA